MQVGCIFTPVITIKLIIMSEFKGTKGEWYVERTSSEDGDFQGKILCKSSEKKSPHKDEPQIYIIAGEPSKGNGVANIHCEANAKLIAAAPDLLETLIKVQDFIEKYENTNYWARLIGNEIDIEKAINKALK